MCENQKTALYKRDCLPEAKVVIPQQSQAKNITTVASVKTVFTAQRNCSSAAILAWNITFH